MTQQENENPRMAGGIFIMLGLLIGSIIGLFAGETSLGMIIGFAVGVILAAAVWIYDSRMRKES